MLGKTIVPSFILMALLPIVLLAANASAVSACELGSGSDSGCGDWHFRQRQIVPVPIAAIKVASAPRGDSPATALEIADTWRAIDPGASVWFKTNDSASYRDIELWIDSPASNALDLSIFSPDQTGGLGVNSKPVGRGSFNKGEPQHALTWKAGYAKGGIWYALVQNFSNAPVSYKLDGNLSSTDAKFCHGYWETLRGQLIYWVDCNPLHNPQ
ncbi:MAG TPA: hypothetical protein VF429_01285 [Anaerolineae bacterium]